MEWFVNSYLRQSDKTLRVLDVGSYDFNGSYRDIFTGSEFDYVGCDMCSGPNVDVLAENPYCWPMFEDGVFDAVISGQTFEHNEFFWLTVKEMVRVLKPEGWLCIIAPRFSARHRYPIDAYRFDTEGMIAIARYGGLEPVHASMNMAPAGASAEWYDFESGDAMLVAQKPAIWKGFVNPEKYVFTQPDLDALCTGFVEYPAQNDLCQRPDYLPRPPADRSTWAYLEYKALKLVRFVFRKFDPRGEGWRTRRERKADHSSNSG